VALERPEVTNPENEQSAFSFGPLQAVVRRWPLLLIGLTIGMLVGALIQVTSTRIYASSAALLVIKKRPDIVTTSDSRLNIVEDYVSTQLTLIKSEKIRRAAAAELRKSPLSKPLPDDDEVVAGMLNSIGATRDLTQASSGANNNIVILSVRGTDSRDTRYYLDAIIKAYQNELAGVYDKATRERLDSLDNARKIQQENKERLGKDMLVQDRALNQITTESTASIQGRITNSKDKLNTLSLDGIQIKQQLELIALAGKNRRDRIAVLAQITGTRMVDAAAGAPGSTEQSIRLLEAKRESQGEKLGKDHPEMKEIESQIKFYKSEQARMNPDDPTGMLDELGAIEKNLKQRSIVTELQVKELVNNLQKDEKNLQDAAGIRSQIDLIRLQMNSAQAEIDRLNLEKSNTMVTQNLGGFEATPITPPAFGVQVAPVLFTSVAYGLLIGIVLGGGAIALAELSDRSFRSPTEIRRRLGVPVIGHIPELRTATAIATVDINVEPALTTGLRPKSNEAEAYRGVRTQLYFSTQGRGHQVIQVTSPSPGDGKSTLAANLATVIAQSGKRVVLIDCDFRKPQVHKIFRLGDVECGLADVVAGTAPMAKALRRSTAIPGLDLMPCGPRPSNPAELLTSPRFDQVLKDLKDAYDFVVVDTPPMLAVSDPANVAAKADGVIMVFRMTRAVRPQAERSIEALNAIGANVLGLVVNGGGDGNQGYGSYNYGHGYGYKYSYYEYSKTYGEEEDLKELAAKK
jgi:polysaccharide biosynthesis transport protein